VSGSSQSESSGTDEVSGGISDEFHDDRLPLGVHRWYFEGLRGSERDEQRQQSGSRASATVAVVRKDAPS